MLLLPPGADDDPRLGLVQQQQWLLHSHLQLLSRLYEHERQHYTMQIRTAKLGLEHTTTADPIGRQIGLVGDGLYGTESSARQGKLARQDR